MTVHDEGALRSFVDILAHLTVSFVVFWVNT